MGKGAGRLPRIAEEAGFRDFIFTTEPLMGNRLGGATLSDRKRSDSTGGRLQAEPGFGVFVRGNEY